MELMYYVSLIWPPYTPFYKYGTFRVTTAYVAVNPNKIRPTNWIDRWNFCDGKPLLNILGTRHWVGMKFTLADATSWQVYKESGIPLWYAYYDYVK